MHENTCFHKVKREPSSEEDEHDDSFPLFSEQMSPEEPCPLESLCPAPPAAVPVPAPPPPPSQTTLHTLHAATNGCSLLDSQIRLGSPSHEENEYTLLAVKEEPLHEGEPAPESDESPSEYRSGHKSWAHEDMERALDALRTHSMTLTKASSTFGIPSTTLWQRAHRLGITTPKRESGARAWHHRDLTLALDKLRNGEISANKASKAYGIPSSTLYKIARREGIRLAAPFNAAPTAWRRPDLARALEDIRRGDATVQTAAAIYGIPTGTLYGRCKREGIELSRSNPTPWSEDAMREALEAVRVGQMSINQAAIHFNLPYSSLYGRFKRCRYTATQQGQQPHQHPDTAQPEQSTTQPEQQTTNLERDTTQPDQPYYVSPSTSEQGILYPYIHPQYETDYITEMYYTNTNGLTS